MTAYDVELSPAAAKAFGKLEAATARRIRVSLEKLADQAAEAGTRGGKSVKTLRGTDGPFHRLRVGDHRVMFEVIDDDRTVLILGIVHRGDLDRWIRNR